jgi:hypothetical protein
MTGVAVVTLPAVSEKLADIAPCATVALAGTLPAAGFELESDTTTPPAGAGEVRVIVPVPTWPLINVLGTIEMPLSAGVSGLMVTLAVRLIPE